MKNYINNYWPFELDRVETFAYQDEVFNKKECEKIIDISKKFGLEKGQVLTKNNVLGKHKMRDSDICFLPITKDTEWVYKRIASSVNFLNNTFFKFDISGLAENIQFSSYKAPGGKYEKHTDRAMGIIVRKLSVSVQLSDPNSYEGGDLIFHLGGKAFKKEKEDRNQGRLIVFPSYTVHEVTPVTKGERCSLVCWVTGKQFK